MSSSELYTGDPGMPRDPYKAPTPKVQASAVPISQSTSVLDSILSELVIHPDKLIVIPNEVVSKITTNFRPHEGTVVVAGEDTGFSVGDRVFWGKQYAIPERIELQPNEEYLVFDKTQILMCVPYIKDVPVL